MEFFEIEIVYHAAESGEIVVTLNHFRQLVVDERSSEDGVEMAEHDSVQLSREVAEEKVLRVQTLRQSLRWERVC